MLAHSTTCYKGTVRDARDLCHWMLPPEAVCLPPNTTQNEQYTCYVAHD